MKRKARSQLAVQREPCYMLRLPLEILAEILSYARTPDILALARTSKHYCAILAINPSSKYIWKKARARFTPMPIPEPTSNFTECSFAALLFDNGVCEICRKKTKEPLLSYALRLRFCSVSCRNDWRRHHMKVNWMIPQDQTFTWMTAPLPRAEDNCYEFTAALGFSRTFKLSDWREEVDAKNRADSLPLTRKDYLRNREVRIQRTNAYMALCFRLITWRNAYIESQEKIRRDNLAVAAGIASTLSLPVIDLHRTATFSQLYRRKTSSLEQITLEDFSRIEEKVQNDLTDIRARKKRHEEEQAMQEKRKAVETIHGHLSSKPNLTMPSLPTFRKLPLVSRLQGCSTASSVVTEIKQSPLIASLVEEDLSRWRQEARVSLANVLGFEPVTAPSLSTLDPVDRLTARFRCRRCDSNTKSWLGDGGMSFSEACSHQCRLSGKGSRKQRPWTAGQFIPDSKAIDAIRQVLLWRGYTDDDVLSLEAPLEVGSRIQCLSCPSGIVMTYNNLLRHCHRHESMQLQVLSFDEVAEILLYPIEEGRRAQLTRPSAQAERQHRIYGCRHCQQIPPVPSNNVSSISASPNMEAGSSQSDGASGSSSTATDGTRGSLAEAGISQKPRSLHLFTFDGLRSHVREKHGILWLGDEDFFRHLEGEAIPPSQDLFAALFM